MNLSRRSLITGLASFVAAPAIVRAASIMPVKAWEPLYPSVYFTLNDGTMKRFVYDDYRRAWDEIADLVTNPPFPTSREIQARRVEVATAFSALLRPGIITGT